MFKYSIYTFLTSVLLSRSSAMSFLLKITSSRPFKFISSISLLTEEAINLFVNELL